MARKETLNARAARLNRPVVLRVELSVSTLADVDELAPLFGVTRSQVIREAVYEWTRRNAVKRTRRERLEVEQSLRESRDEVPLGPLLDGFRAQMEGAVSGPSENFGLRSVPKRATVGRMKAVKAEIDEGFYERIAAVAAADDRPIASLIRMGLEKVAAEHDAKERQEQSVAAA